MSETTFTDTVPRAIVQPNHEGLGTEGPRDLDDLIVHNGEARGLADTARHSLEPDAPTVGAAEGEPQPSGSEALINLPELTNSDGSPDG